MAPTCLGHGSPTGGSGQDSASWASGQEHTVATATTLWLPRVPASPGHHRPAALQGSERQPWRQARPINQRRLLTSHFLHKKKTRFLQRRPLPETPRDEAAPGMAPGGRRVSCPSAQCSGPMPG